MADVHGQRRSATWDRHGQESSLIRASSVMSQNRCNLMQATIDQFLGKDSAIFFAGGGGSTVTDRAIVAQAVPAAEIH